MGIPFFWRLNQSLKEFSLFFNGNGNDGETSFSSFT